MIRLGPIPVHLAEHDWYAPHQAYLRRCRLPHHDPGSADARLACLKDADMTDANLKGARLMCAFLANADLTGADLTDADLRAAVLTDAVLPDGRTLKEWQADPLAGLCTEPEAVARATAAWRKHTWRDCPLRKGMGISGLLDIDDDAKRRLAACFVALFDGYHLPKPITD